MRNDQPRNRPKEGPADWPVQILEYATHKWKKAGFRYVYEAHAGHEIMYVDYGRMHLVLEGRRVTLEPGDCLIVPERTHHSSRAERTAPFSFLNIVFYGRCPAGLGGVTLHLTAAERRLMRDIKEEEAVRGAHHTDIATLKLNLLLLLLKRRRTKSESDQTSQGENRVNYRSAIVSKAMAFLDQEQMRPLDTRAVARHAGVSASHLRRLIRQEIGRPLSAQLRQTRIESAKRLLLNTSANISEVSRTVGYQSVPHFYVVFKRETGMTPTAFSRSLGTPPSR